MEEYIGKICPFCKMEIKEGDAVKVCPSCDIPHHEACWEENKGCTTSGCSEQHNEEQHTDPTNVCAKCGAPLEDGQDFCPKCGALVSDKPTELNLEQYIGKICPFCKTEIKKGDAVKVCPSCDIPHHEACWEENKGCTTFGCSEQHYEEQHTNPTEVCTNCGAPLGDGQDFCPKCGTPKKAEKEKKNICSKCGAELQEGQAFCPKCGQKADLRIDSGVNTAISQFNSEVQKTNEAKKKKPIKIIIIAAAVVVVVVLAIIFIPKIFKSADEYMALGNYEKAYSMMNSEDEKTKVVAEDVIAVCCKDCVDSLKDSKSFDLREAYFDSEKSYVVLKVAGNNSYGNTIINYWLYTYNTDDAKFKLYGSYSDLEEEEIYTYLDSKSEKLEKIINNLGKSIISSTMTSANKLSNDGVKRINSHFANETLDDISLIEGVEYKTKSTD